MHDYTCNLAALVSRTKTEIVMEMIAMMTITFLGSGGPLRPLEAGHNGFLFYSVVRLDTFSGKSAHFNYKSICILIKRNDLMFQNSMVNSL